MTNIDTIINNIKIITNNIKKFSLKINEDNISEYAAEVAYFTILSFIPFTLFFLTLIKFTNIEKETLFLVLKEFIPTSVNSTILNIVDDIYSKSVRIMSFSFVVAIWAAGKGFFSLCKGLRSIYKISTKSNLLLRIVGSIYTLILIIAIIIFLFLIVLGKKMYIFLMNKFQEVSQIIYFLYKLRIVFSIILMIVIFSLLYKIVANKRNNNFSHIYGAIFASIAWQVISHFISIYIEISKGFTNMYGSLSSIILIMLWIYMCMYIILFGAEINVLINDYKNNELIKFTSKTK